MTTAEHLATVEAFKARIAKAQAQIIQDRATIAALRAGNTLAAYYAQSPAATYCANVEAGNARTISL